MDIEIEEVKQEIRKVEQQIVYVEGQLTQAATEVDVAYWRNKEEQLRKEKEQLRNKEEQLREEKLHLLKKEEQVREKDLLLFKAETSDLLGTEHEWLVQKVVELALPSRASSQPSTSNKDRLYTPLEVEHWDVKDSVEAYLRSTDNKRRAYELSVTKSTEAINSFQTFRTDYVSIILRELVHFLRKKKDPLFDIKKEVSLKKEYYDGMDVDDAVAQKLRFPVRADFLVTLREKACYPVEVKNGGLGPHEGESWKLHEVWANYTSKEGAHSEDSGIAKSHSLKVMRCICQLYEYMVLAKVGYGVLTDATYWYLFKRDNAGLVKISPGFKASDEPPLLLAALSYLANTAVEDNTLYSNQVVRGQFPTSPGDAPPESSDEGFDDKTRDADYRGAGTRNSGSGVRRSGRIGVNEKQLALQDMSAENLNFKCSSILSCDGWSGFVFIGQLYGKPVALKFADVGTTRAEALVQEAKAYAKMEKLWGRVVPELVGHGFADSSRRIVYVATELLEGSELGDVTVTKEVECAALEALDAVHACGLLHGDISPKNIMVVKGKQPSVRFVDFGFSCFKSNKKLQKAERMYLEQLLIELMQQGRE